MATLLVPLAAVVAVAAAIRSTWSPCGLSMLSSITPMGEAARHHRYATTAAWFVTGAVLGGLTLAAGTALLAAGVHALDLDVSARLALAAVLAAVTLASDVNVGGFRLPSHTRQVDERWLEEYRPWIYGTGYGWQIGVGLATFVTTAAVYLMIGLAALTASPVAAALLMTGFGLIRGLAVLLGAGMTTPERLFALHRRMEELLPTAQRGIVLVQAAVVALASGAVWGPAPALVLGVGGLAVTVARQPRPFRHPQLA